MRYIFKFPDIGEGIAEGKILEWYVKKGQEIKSGDSIVKMETDKVVTDIPSPKDGTIVAIFGKIDEVINVDDPLIELEIEGVDGEEAQAVAQETSDAPKEEGVEEKGFGVVGTIEVANDSSFLPAGIEGREEEPKSETVKTKALATPVARAMAKDLGIDINQVPGSGTNGRVMKEDIKQYQGRIQKGSPAQLARVVKDFGPEVDIKPMSQIRKAIARNMSLSKQTAAH
ncbi:MAG: E3 binding domain-containing protein, partial [Chlorobi bacterium]|nr:E3 binding domain-containing protein [Chlorobiota bacterium]